MLIKGNTVTTVMYRNYYNNPQQSITINESDNV